jgi:hypothetical protein
VLAVVVEAVRVIVEGGPWSWSRSRCQVQPRPSSRLCGRRSSRVAVVVGAGSVVCAHCEMHANTGSREGPCDLHWRGLFVLSWKAPT